MTTEHEHEQEELERSPKLTPRANSFLSSDGETDDEIKNVRPSSNQHQYAKDDPTLDFLHKPRTISALFCMLSIGFYIALYSDTKEPLEHDVKWGLAAAAITFVFIGTMLFKDGPFSRPHPAVWRAILSISIVYELFLVFMLFLKVDDARQLFRFINPELGVPLPERSYAEFCDFTLENLLGGIDEFVIAHVLGWWAKTIILRDVWMAWILSIMFEVMEYTLQHHLPNFAECWWDHWILDVLLCNWMGIYLGMKTLKFLETKTYNWRGWKQIPTKRGKAKRAIQQFTPESWTIFEWGATKNLKRWLTAFSIIAIVLQSELNAFYLKYILWFPPTEALNTYRLILHFATGIVGMREVYLFLTDSKCKRIGSQCWVLIAIIQTETLLCIKWGKGLFPNPAPPMIVNGWIIFICLFVLFTIFRFIDVKSYFFPSKPKIHRNHKHD